LGGLLEALLAVVLATAIASVILLATGHDPIVAWRELIERALLRPSGLQEVVVRATPPLIVGVAVLLAARAGLWNIGVDGQVLVAALAAAVAGHLLDDTSRIVLWGGALMSAAIAGAAWAAVPAIVRARWGVNEIVTTIMFNYVAFSLTAWLVKGPLRDDSLVAAQTPLIPRELRFVDIGATRIHVGIVLALVIWIAFTWWLGRSEAGFNLRAVGENAIAANHAMIRVGVILTVALIASGAVAGLAGGNDVLATKGTFQAEWNPSYGLTAFALVFLARRNALGLLPAALFLGALSYGADVMPRAADVPSAFFDLYEGILLIVLAVFHWRPWNRLGAFK
jgi:simple sugar transport system permease protein